MNCRQLAYGSLWELRLMSSPRAIFWRRKAQDKANLIYQANLVNYSFFFSRILSIYVYTNINFATLLNLFPSHLPPFSFLSLSYSPFPSKQFTHKDMGF